MLLFIWGENNINRSGNINNNMKLDGDDTVNCTRCYTRQTRRKVFSCDVIFFPHSTMLLLVVCLMAAGELLVMGWFE